MTPPTTPTPLEYARTRLDELLAMLASPAWLQVIHPMLTSAREELSQRVLTTPGLTPVQREEARQHYLAYTALLDRIDAEITSHCQLLAQQGYEIPSAHQHRVPARSTTQAQSGPLADPFAIMGSNASPMLRELISKLPPPVHSPTTP